MKSGKIRPHREACFRFQRDKPCWFLSHVRGVCDGNNRYVLDSRNNRPRDGQVNFRGDQRAQICTQLGSGVRRFDIQQVLFHLM